jgi:hypothetical protein
MEALWGEQNGLFEPILSILKRSFYQDRLGTNIGKALNCKSGVFLRQCQCQLPNGCRQWTVFLHAAIDCAVNKRHFCTIYI